MQLTAQQQAHVLSVWPVARLASIGADGRPHQVPIVFVAVAGILYSPIDGKAKRVGNSSGLQRVRNIVRNKSVSLLLDHYDTDWQCLWWFRIDADADVVAGRAVPLDSIGAALRRKYPQYASVELFAGEPTLLRMKPLRHTAWSAEPRVWESLR